MMENHNFKAMMFMLIFAFVVTSEAAYLILGFYILN